MISENKKSSLEKALLEAKEIEQAAVKSAKKILEESVISKIEEAVKETVLDIEKKSLKESVSIEVDSDDVSLEVKNGVTTINVEDAEEDDLKISSEDSKNTEEEMEDFEEMEDSEEMEGSEEMEDSEDMEDSENEDDDELFEVFNLFEEEAPVEETPVEEAPVEEAPVEEVPVEGSEEEMDFDLGNEEEMEGSAETAEVVTKAGYDSLSQKLDDILNKLSTAEEVVASAEPETEVATTETSDQTIAPEGEVEIVDDEEMVQQTTPTEEIPTEGGEEEMVSEDDDIEIEDLINELMGEISLENEEEDLEIDFEDENEELEEITGLSRSVGAPKFGHKHKNPDGHRSPVNTLHIKENNAHQEAKLAELTKENESLKESLREYKESFKVLRKQINEVQTFNAKLAYVNKLFSKGGLTNDEKVQIAESFDNVETIEEAKSLYNKIINENTTLSEGKTEQLKSKLKSKNPAVVSTKTETLYESTEVSRMKQLAGIRTLKN